MEKNTTDSDNGPSPSDTEKHVENGVPVDVAYLPDPDEGLTEEERKRIVRRDPVQGTLLTC